MNVALWLLASQGVIGSFDTLYYHEWRARLPARGPRAAAELHLHAVRDFLYAALFTMLPWATWRGRWVWLLASILIAEIVITLADFVVEVRVRKPIGDVYVGERVTHAAMGILYGAMMAYLVAALWRDAAAPTSIGPPADAPGSLRWALTLMGVGVRLSGLRDLYAAFGLPHGGWPWPEATGWTS